MALLTNYSWIRCSSTNKHIAIVAIQLLGCIWFFVTPWTTARQGSLSFTISQSLLKLMSIESVMTFNHLILCHPLLLLTSIFPSIRVFSNELALHIRSPKYWSFSISLPNEYSGLISFRMDWFDLLAVQGISRVFSNITVQKHQFFEGPQPSLWSNSHIHTCIHAYIHPHMITGKIIAVTIGNFLGKVMSLLFNMLSRFVIVFLPRNRSL